MRRSAERIDIDELTADPGALQAMIARGAIFIVCEDGQPIAEVSPLEIQKRLSASQVGERLEKLGKTEISLPRQSVTPPLDLSDETDLPT